MGPEHRALFSSVQVRWRPASWRPRSQHKVAAFQPIIYRRFCVSPNGASMGLQLFSPYHSSLALRRNVASRFRSIVPEASHPVISATAARSGRDQWEHTELSLFGFRLLSQHSIMRPRVATNVSVHARGLPRRCATLCSISNTFHMFLRFRPWPSDFRPVYHGHTDRL